MPQLSQIGEIYASQLFWLAIVFALIYFVIGRGMVPKIEQTVDLRNATISGDLGAAEAARANAAQLEEGYHSSLSAARSKAIAEITAAKDEAGRLASVAAKAGDAKVADQLTVATDRIGQARKAALSEIEAATVDIVEAIVAKLSGGKVDRKMVATEVASEFARG